MNADELDDLRQLLATHRQTLAILLRQVAKHGEANAPPAQIGGIAEARMRIAELKQALRAQGEAVEDRLGDVAAPLLPADSNSGGVDDAQSGDIDGLLRHADDDRWRETIILAAGLTTTRQSDRLLQGLLEQPAEPKAADGLPELSGRARPASEQSSDVAQRRTRRLTLAVACLETCVQRSPEIAADVLQQVKPLFPLGNEDEARLLAAAGPAAIALLLPAAGHTENEAAACVSALAQIGGDAALEALRSYVADQRGEVVRTLCDAWERFDRHSYARAILAKMPWLRFSQVSTWADWELLTGVRELYIESLQLADITPLGALTGLTTLVLLSTLVRDLTPLGALTSLTTLFLGATLVRDLRPVQGLRGLTIKR